MSAPKIAAHLFLWLVVAVSFSMVLAGVVVHFLNS
jgi:hypothetical protein